MRILCYSYCVFIFSLPFEGVDIGIGLQDFSLAKLFGYIFFATTLFQPHLCFRRAPKEVWCFVGYAVVFAVSSVLLNAQFMTTQLITLVQLLLFLWISCNLLRDEVVRRGVLWSLALACVVLGGVAAVGFEAGLDTKDVGDRASALGYNPNTTATILGLGLLLLLGLAKQGRIGRVARLFVWISSGILIIGSVRTGSRGNMLALIVGVAVLLLAGSRVIATVISRGKRVIAALRTSKVKSLMLALLVVGALVGASYQIDAVRERWERTLEKGDTAGRDEIFDSAWEMFSEKPLTGWGPGNHVPELGRRLRVPSGNRDTHNTYLWVLTETGLLGAIPFFAGLWLCCCAAWKARHGTQGVLPLAILLFLLLVAMKGTTINHKLLWVMLAYAQASCHSIVPASRRRQTYLYC